MTDATFTDRLGLLQQAYRSNPEAWGTELNEAVIGLIDNMVGYAPITVDADVTLNWEDGATNQVQNGFLRFVGAGGHTVTVKGVDRFYLIANGCAADVTVKPEDGSGSVIRAGTLALWYTDGVTGHTVDNTLDRVAKPVANVDLNSKKITNLADGTAPQDAVNRGQLDLIAGSTDAAVQAASDAQAALNSINAKITISTQPPQESDGQDGDLWFLIA